MEKLLARAGAAVQVTCGEGDCQVGRTLVRNMAHVTDGPILLGWASTRPWTGWPGRDRLTRFDLALQSLHLCRLLHIEQLPASSIHHTP
jgi:hypothetical protein